MENSHVSLFVVYKGVSSKVACSEGCPFWYHGIHLYHAVKLPSWYHVGLRHNCVVYISVAVVCFVLGGTLIIIGVGRLVYYYATLR